MFFIMFKFSTAICAQYLAMFRFILCLFDLFLATFVGSK